MSENEITKGQELTSEIAEEVKDQIVEETQENAVEAAVEEAVTAEEPKAEETQTEAAQTEETKSETVEVPVEEINETITEEVVLDADDDEEEEGVETPEDADEELELTPAVQPVNHEDFDWDNYTSDHDDYTADERAKLVAVFDETLSSVGEAEVIDGTVVFMNKREVVVNIGYKSEGVVSLNEFRYNPELKAGDTVEVYVETLEDRNGQLVISHKKARALRSWDRVNQAFDGAEVIRGYIKCRTKGGMIVDVFGIEAFLPGSQIDVKPIRDYDMYVGKTMEFKVVKINQEFKNVVVSHKALIEAELEVQKQEIISKLEKGQVLEGTVKNITSYGVFIDLGGVDGLIHITDLSWGRVNHPEEIVTLDQKINVVILDFDDNKKRIALGLKQLTPHPWDSLDAKLQVGDVVKGKVVVMADYGAFVEIATGVEGLIHVSEMSWSQHLRSAQEFLKVGDEVDAQVLTLDREERKMSLGIKQLHQDPWDKIEEKYAISSKHTAKVRNFTGFGVFVEIEEGVDGLIHISDLSWTKKIKHPAEFCSIGDEIEVVVLEIDQENRRLSLGHKQLEENPWDVFETLFSVGSVHEGTIVNLFDRGAVITLPYGVEGFATPRHLAKEDGSQAKVDERLEFKVIEFNKSAKRIILSHSRVFEDEKRTAETTEKRAKADTAQKGMKKVKQNLEATTLGDISDLAVLKSQMEAEEKGEAQKKAAKMEAAAAKKVKDAAAKAEKAKEAEKPAEAVVVEAEAKSDPVVVEAEPVEGEEKAEVEAKEVKPAAKKPAAKTAAKKTAAKTTEAKKAAPKKKAAAKPAESEAKAEDDKKDE